MNFKIDSMTTATVFWEALLGPAVHLEKLHLERMFTKKKYLTEACQFSSASYYPRLKEFYLGDSFINSKTLIVMAEKFTDRDKFIALKELTLNGEEGTLKDQRLVSWITVFSQQGVTLSIDTYDAKAY